MKALIISQPKSGTYLASELLVNLGMYQTYLHFLSHVTYTQYNKDNVLDGRYNPRNYAKHDNIETAISKVPQNGFAVTHIQYTDLWARRFGKFKKIILTRPAQERKQSGIDWNKEAGRTIPPLAVDHLVWLKEPNTFHLEFKDMLDINVEKLDALQKFLFGAVVHESALAMQKSLDAETLTKSNKRRG